MAAVAPSSPFSNASGYVHVDPLRRQLSADLVEIKKVIARSGLNDPITEQITEWHKLFIADLQDSGNTEAVRDKFIALLQLILLGREDDNYFSFNPHQPQWIFQDHPVVKSLITWMEGHNAPPHAKILAEALLRRQHQYRERAEQKNAEGREEKHKVKAEERPSARELLRARRAQMRHRDPFQDVRQRAEDLHAVEQASLNQLQAQVAGARRQYSAFQERVNAFEERVVANNRSKEEQNQGALRQFEHIVDDMEAEIAELEQHNRELKEQLDQLSNEIHDARCEAIALKQQAIEMSIQMQKMKKGSMKELVSTIAIVGVSILAGCAFASAFKGSAVKIGIQPAAKGARLFVAIPT